MRQQYVAPRAPSVCRALIFVAPVIAHTPAALQHSLMLPRVP